MFCFSQILNSLTKQHRVIQEEEKSRAVQAQQSIEIATAAAAVDAETGRCNRAERLLFSLESRLAELNDKFEQKTVEAAPPEAPVRSFVQEPPPQTATEAAARALEQRLSRLTGSSITLLAVDVPLSRGVVDLLAVDKRGRLFLIFFPAASEISTHHIEHIDDTRSSFYTIRSLPSALVAELTCCFTRHPPPNPPSMTQRSASDVRRHTHRCCFATVVSLLSGVVVKGAQNNCCRPRGGQRAGKSRREAGY